MIKKVLSILLFSALFITCLSGCGKSSVKIGVSIGAGPAARWDKEKTYMEACAQELETQIEVRLNRTDEPPQTTDCFELIDSGIDVLILMPRNGLDAEPILEYASKKKVPVIAYSRAIYDDRATLFVGYDSYRIGQRMGQYLTENVYSGDYIILSGGDGDINAKLIYNGAMSYIEPIKDNINILLDESVTNWSPDVAKELVTKAVNANNGKVDAILAPNDTIAGACAEALEECGVTTHVVITGMDAELSAVHRLLDGKQDMTTAMDLRELSKTAVTEAIKLARGEAITINAEFESPEGYKIDSNLIPGHVVTKENIDKVLIDGGYFAKEEIYGE